MARKLELPDCWHCPFRREMYYKCSFDYNYCTLTNETLDFKYPQCFGNDCPIPKNGKMDVEMTRQPEVQNG